MERILIILITLLLLINNEHNFEIKQNNQIAADSNINNSDENSDRIFYGDWIVKKVITYDRINAMEDEEVKGIINKKLSISSNVVEFNEESLSNPYYKISEVSDTSFCTSGFLTLEDIGIDNEYTEKVQIFAKETDDYGYYWYMFGGTFYIKDKDTLIVDYKGAYFELKRK